MIRSIILILVIIFAGNIFPAEDFIKNRIVYLIHGDGDYLYHEEGESFQADYAVLQQALDNARKGKHSEYFIFHFKPKRNFLVFFPGEESDFYHYRYGQLISEKKYFRFEPVEGHSAEAYLLKESIPIKDAANNILLYYGHEISLNEEYGYNASFPEVPCGLESFTGRTTEIINALDQTKFDLIVLSTCNNGSPDFILELASSADYIIASPGDLHLSQMNSASLKMLETENAPAMNAFALHFASAAFDILRIKAFTEVVLSVYNTEELLNGYDPDVICAGEVNMNDIVRVFFRPAKFGKFKNRTTHNGWYCADQNTLSQSTNP